MLRKPIEDAILREAVARLVDGLHPRAIILFGSQARGTDRAESDYDLLVISDELWCHVPLNPGNNRSRTQAAFCGPPATTAFCCMANPAATSHRYPIAEGRVLSPLQREMVESDIATVLCLIEDVNQVIDGPT